MTNKKKLTLFAALSVLIIAAGAVLYALFGFQSTTKSVASIEVVYDAIVTINEEEDRLEQVCEDAFSAQGLKIKEKRTSLARDLNSIGETGDRRLVYRFSANSSETSLASAVTAISSASFGDAEIYAEYHIEEDVKFYEGVWRGALAIITAAVVALVYLGFRYGAASALSALFAVLDGSLLSAALFAIVRIPVYPYVPVLFAALGGIFTLLLWIAICAKIRALSKDPSSATLSAEEKVKEGCRAARRQVLFLAIGFAAAFVVLGAVAAAGTRLFFLPALLPLAVSLFAAMIFAPCILAPLKDKFDSAKAKRKRYSGKKKESAPESVESAE